MNNSLFLGPSKIVFEIIFQYLIGTFDLGDKFINERQFEGSKHQFVKKIAVSGVNSHSKIIVGVPSSSVK